MTKLAKDDKEWINGWFEGNSSGKEEAILEMIRYLKKHLKIKTRTRKSNKFEAVRT